MGSFLDYLDDLPEFDQRVEQVKRKIVRKNLNEKPKKEKVLALNVEVRTVDGARTVINKLNEWISKFEGENPKPSFRIKPKKVVRGTSISPMVKTISESTSRASSILDRLPDEPEQNSEPIIMNQGINNMVPQMQPQMPELNLESVAGHASALL